MNNKSKKDIREKTRLAYGLTHVLKEEIDYLRSDVNAFDVYMIRASVKDVADTIDRLANTVGEIEYLLFLDSLREKNTAYYDRKNKQN